MKKDILIYAEIIDGKVTDNALELIGEARRLTSLLPDGGQVISVVMGKAVRQHADLLAAYGAERVVIFENDILEHYRNDLYGEALTAVIRKCSPEIVLIGSSYRGSEIAPTVAAKLRTGLAAHCTELKIDSTGQFIQVVPAFGGKVLGDILTPGHRPKMASIKPGIMQKRPIEACSASIEEFTTDIQGLGNAIKFLDDERISTSGKPLHEAECIIGGGFGIGSKENWAVLEELATLLNGATGCTRPALDEGWTTGEQTMIGTSGVAVRPKVYINAGISGAAHHTCGMKDAGLVISINKDENAAIFGSSDIKIVADWKQILPILIEKVKEAKSGN